MRSFLLLVAVLAAERHDHGRRGRHGHGDHQGRHGHEDHGRHGRHGHGGRDGDEGEGQHRDPHKGGGNIAQELEHENAFHGDLDKFASGLGGMKEKLDSLKGDLKGGAKIDQSQLTNMIDSLAMMGDMPHEDHHIVGTGANKMYDLRYLSKMHPMTPAPAAPAAGLKIPGLPDGITLPAGLKLPEGLKLPDGINAAAMKQAGVLPAASPAASPALPAGQLPNGAKLPEQPAGFNMPEGMGDMQSTLAGLAAKMGIKMPLLAGGAPAAVAPAAAPAAAPAVAAPAVPVAAAVPAVAVPVAPAAVAAAPAAAAPQAPQAGLQGDVQQLRSALAKDQALADRVARELAQSPPGDSGALSQLAATEQANQQMLAKVMAANTEATTRATKAEDHASELEQQLKEMTDRATKAESKVTELAAVQVKASTATPTPSPELAAAKKAQQEQADRITQLSQQLAELQKKCSSEQAKPEAAEADSDESTDDLVNSVLGSDKK